MSRRPLQAPVRSPLNEPGGLARSWREWFDNLRNSFVESLDSAEDAEALAAAGPAPFAEAGDILSRLDALERDMASVVAPAVEPFALPITQDGDAVGVAEFIDCQGLILAERAGSGVSVRLREPVFADGDIVTGDGEYVWGGEE